MASTQIKYADLRDGEDVTLKLREGESVIVGTVVGSTDGGGKRVKLKNNRNSVVLYENTNFRIFAERDPSINDLLADLTIGTVFTYRNSGGYTIEWVKTGDDRVTRVDDERPAYSLSISGGFTDQGDALSRLTVKSAAVPGEYEYVDDVEDDYDF